MSSEPTSDGGLPASFRRLGSSLLGLVRTRIELFAVELQEQKLQATGLLLWLAVAVALSVAAILLALGTLALFLWNTAGYPGLVGLSLLVAGAAAGVLLLIRRRILRAAPPFAATAAEFQKDLEHLRREP